MKRGILAGMLIPWLMMLVACSDEASPTGPQFSDAPQVGKTVYRFGVHPLYNPERLHQLFGPLMRYLSDHIEGVEFRLEASRNYAAYDQKLADAAFQFALPNPYQTLQSFDHGYHVFGKMGDDENFRGIILVRKDSGLNEVGDLKGKAISYPAPTALAATMMPQYYLYEHGLDVMHEVDNRYVGSQESSVMNVYLGQTAAGATWPPPWRAMVESRPELAERLEVRWQTEPLPNNGLVVREDVPAEITRQVAALLFGLHTHEAGRRLLAPMRLSRFEAADDTTYQPVRDFLTVFAEKVRSPETAN